MDLGIAVAHRPNPALDERDLVLCNAVLLVEHFVCPFSIHRQSWNECKSLAVDVLCVGSQGDEETHKLCAQVGTEILSLRFRVETTGNEISLSADGPGRAN